MKMVFDMHICMHICMYVHVGAKFRFQVPRHILLAQASAAALTYINNTNASNNSGTTTNNGSGISGSGSGSGSGSQEQCMCVLEFTSMINIAIVREKIVPLIHTRQQLLMQSIS